MVTTADDALAQRMDSLRNHGASVSEEMRHRGPKPYLMAEFALLGFNYRMTDLQGAVGLVQLAKLDRYIDGRQRWAEFYDRELRSVPWLRTPQVEKSYRHGWQSYVCIVDEKKAGRSRNDVMEALLQRGVHTRAGTHAVHALQYYRERGARPGDCPVALECDRTTMAIPLHNRMSEDDYRYVVQALREIS
jgi:dTDP-4-amino-4,6-dideoxygalactose transaminase